MAGGPLPRRLGRLARLRARRGRAPGRRSRDADAGIPPDVWLRVERFVAFDHAAPPRLGGRARRRRSTAFAARGRDRRVATPRPRADAAHADGVAVARHAPGEYAALIERCRDAIREGDAYQLCLTTRFSVDGIRRSRRGLPAPARR